MADKVTGFERSASFLHGAAVKRFEEGRFADALVFVRKALKSDPENPDYLLTEARCLGSVRMFNESNTIIIDLFKRGIYLPDSCYIMGANFFGLGDHEKATECLMRYLESGSDGKYIQNAYNYLAEIYGNPASIPEPFSYDAEREKKYPPLMELSARQDMENAQSGKIHLDRGEYKKAIDYLERVNPKYVFARNNLAVAYFFDKNPEKAISIEREVLDRVPDDVFALCNIALFYNAGKQYRERDSVIEKIDSLSISDSDRLDKIIGTLCEIGSHELVMKFAKKALETNPYDELKLFVCGIAAYNLKLKRTAEYFSLMLKLNPDNTIASYYLGLAKNHPGERHLKYIYEVTPDEVNRRKNWLDSKLAHPVHELKKEFEQGGKLYRMMRWALYGFPPRLVPATAGIIAKFGTERSEKLLREYILHPGQPDAVKNQVILIMGTFGIEEPYVAYLNGSVVEVRVNLPEEKDRKND